MPIKNQLFYGDNLEVLRKHIKDESVDLCYIDPPFNSDENYNQIYTNKHKKDIAQAQAFVDMWTWDNAANEGLDEIVENKNQIYTIQSIQLILGLEKVIGKRSLLAYLVSMTQRIAEIYRILKPTGSFYLHCDPTASHYLKLVLDGLFAARGGVFLNEITWKRKTGCGETNMKSSRFGVCTDIIFFYSKSKKNTFHSQFNFEAKGYGDYVKKFFKHKDENGRIYRLADLSSPSKRLNLTYEYKGYQPPKNGWAVSRTSMEKMDKEGRLYFPKSKEGRIQRKRFSDELKGKPVQNLWDDIEMISAQSAERLGYPTQKPEALLERIIKASSNEGDIVLDAYCGCGTTIAVAERLGRNWIGIDITYQSISLILKRLEDSFGIDFTTDIIDKDSKKVKTSARLELTGEPKDFEAAVALANKKDDRLRKEFEKWAVLKFSKNRAFINDKKGGDGGVDGEALVVDLDEQGRKIYKPVIFSVKSSKTLSPAVMRDLNGTMEREKAVVGYLITLYPMENLVNEAKKYGTYKNQLFETAYAKIEVISIQELLEGARMSLSMTVEVLKSAERKVSENNLPNIFNP
jgi:DNA modification methylase